MAETLKTATVPNESETKRETEETSKNIKAAEVETLHNTIQIQLHTPLLVNIHMD